jgi:hypothetical protein
MASPEINNMTFPPANIMKQMTNSFKVVFLKYCFIGLGAGMCFAQPPMPTNMVYHAMVVNTNVITEGSYTMVKDALAVTQDEVNPYGIVGYVTDATGTNNNIVKIDSQTYVQGNATLITDPDHHEHLQLWRDCNWLSTTDLVNWETNNNFIFAVYDLPCQPYQYFKFTSP